jgi:hypothetical protein
MPNVVLRVVRDVVILAGAYVLLIASHQRPVGSSMMAIPLAVAAGITVVMAAFLVHEWGHLIGAWTRGAVVEVAAKPWALFLFNFDEKRNSREQFLAMSCGGFAASLILVLLLTLTLSLHALADQIALGLTLIGVIATFVLEVPPAWRAYRAA